MADAVKHIWLQDVICDSKQSSESNGTVKDRILEFIIANNGAYFSEIKNTLHLVNGNTQHYLAKLVKEGKLESVKTVNRVYYFPKGKVSEIDGTLEKVLKTIQLCPEKNPQEHAKFLGVSQPIFNNYAEKLVAKHKIGKLKEGNQVRYVVPDILA